MKIFISWSGSLSQKIGEVFKDWLPAVLQTVKPYFTPSDIEKGSRWNSEIAKELEQSKLGLFIFTKENLDSQWMIFEAGAISKTLDTSKVCPLLFGLDNSDFKGPLTQFQTSQFNKIDVKKLTKTINNNLGEQKLEEKVLDEVFEMWWPKLDQKIGRLLDENNVENISVRPDRELLEEVLAIVRFTSKSNFSEKKHKIISTKYDLVTFERLVNSFVSSSLYLFQFDWGHTKICLESDFFVSPSGTFLAPQVDDESANWANRGNYLDSFRKLKAFMEEHELDFDLEVNDDDNF